MATESLIHTLIAMRAQLQALQQQVEAALSLLASSPEPGACPHFNRLNLTVMGGPTRWQCRDCGLEQTEPD